MTAQEHSQDICIIAAVASCGAIGRRGDMPFHISADLRRFKQLTMGCPLIMGRRTFESLPGGALPGRRNIVVTRNALYSAPGAETAPSLAEAIAMCASASKLMIIGGGEIYRQAMPIATSMHLTHIDARVPDADTYFPEVDMSRWLITESSDTETDPRSGVGFRFTDYVLKSTEL
ncbi:MAG: dihydrofolate reductase [Muribaculaceae bacterium]|nr:dihydrofolate reductase [Muribaculaceae bacterium]